MYMNIAEEEQSCYTAAFVKELAASPISSATGAATALASACDCDGGGCSIASC